MYVIVLVRLALIIYMILWNGLKWDVMTALTAETDSWLVSMCISSIPLITTTQTPVGGAAANPSCHWWGAPWTGLPSNHQRSHSHLGQFRVSCCHFIYSTSSCFYHKAIMEGVEETKALLQPTSSACYYFWSLKRLILYSCKCNKMKPPNISRGQVADVWWFGSKCS